MLAHGWPQVYDPLCHSRRGWESMRRSVLIAIPMLCLGFNVSADVPTGRWKLTFAEECGGNTLDASKWIAVRTDPMSADHGSLG